MLSMSVWPRGCLAALKVLGVLPVRVVCPLLRSAAAVRAWWWLFEVWMRFGLGWSGSIWSGGMAWGFLLLSPGASFVGPFLLGCLGSPVLVCRCPFVLGWLRGSGVSVFRDRVLGVLLLLLLRDCCFACASRRVLFSWLVRVGLFLLPRCGSWQPGRPGHRVCGWWRLLWFCSCRVSGRRRLGSLFRICRRFPRGLSCRLVGWLPGCSAVFVSSCFLACGRFLWILALSLRYLLLVVACCCFRRWSWCSWRGAVFWRLVSLVRSVRVAGPACRCASAGWLLLSCCRRGWRLASRWGCALVGGYWWAWRCCCSLRGFCSGAWLLCSVSRPAGAWG